MKTRLLTLLLTFALLINFSGMHALVAEMSGASEMSSLASHNKDHNKDVETTPHCTMHMLSEEPTPFMRPRNLR